MSVSVEMLAVAPGEGVVETIARMFSGEIIVSVDWETGRPVVDVWHGEDDQASSDFHPVPYRRVGHEDFADWRSAAVGRLQGLAAWTGDEVDGFPFLWSDAVGWQIGFHEGGATLHWRGQRRILPDADVGDSELLAAFAGLPSGTLIVWNTEYGVGWADLDDPADSVTAL